MKNLVLIVLICLVSACTGIKNYQLGNSYLGVVPEEKSILKAIADDMANYIAMQYAPGHTSFDLITPKEEKAEVVDDVVIDTFSVIFENALRQKGFEISKKGMELSYTIDSLEEGFYTQIRLGDSNNFSSMYSKSGNSISRSRLGVEHE
jgi:hypothetical protein